MKFLQLAIGFVLSTTLLTACGSDDKKQGESGEQTKEETVTADNGPSSKLEGAWEIKRAEGSMESLNVGTVYEFKGSKLSFGKDGFTNPGSTEVTDSTFSFQADGNEYKFMYNYFFNGDTLVVKMQNNNDQVFHMIKK
ncbi:MAG: hypothetical protein KAY50_03325 [Chitinophagaceae bacterium]|nr:hypothetical protein [Chitinophagaceae bacterium]